MFIKSRSVDHTEQIGKQIGQTLKIGSCVAMFGDLGAGKTAMTRGIAAGMGITDTVSSPTYTIVNEYLSGEIPLIHIDAYRLKNADELFDLGFDEYLDRAAVVVEWSENVLPAIPENAMKVTLERIDGDERDITVSGEGELYA